MGPSDIMRSLFLCLVGLSVAVPAGAQSSKLTTVLGELVRANQGRATTLAAVWSVAACTTSVMFGPRTSHRRRRGAGDRVPGQDWWLAAAPRSWRCQE